jgi:hypothetical protein
MKLRRQNLKFYIFKTILSKALRYLVVIQNHFMWQSCDKICFIYVSLHLVPFPPIRDRDKIGSVFFDSNWSLFLPTKGLQFRRFINCN